MVAVDLLPMLEAEAEVRMKAGKKLDPPPILGEAYVGESARQAAEIAHVSHGYVSDDKHLTLAAPDLAAQVRT
jgi:hypothetical protein